MGYGYKAILSLDGEENLELDNCSYSYVKDINEKTGEVQSTVLSGTIYAGYSDCPSLSMWEWALHYRFKNGKIRLKRSDSNLGNFVSEAEVTLEKAACVGLKLNYRRMGGSHFYTQLTITSNNSVIGDTADWVKKDWLLNE